MPALGLEDVAAAIRSELRLEAEEAEREAAISAAMQRNLAQAASELMAHGDTVTLELGDNRFVGRITGVGSDFLTLDAGSGRLDICLGPHWRMRVTQRARAGGLPVGSGTSGSLRARLLELQLTGERVELGTSGTGEPVTGSIALVGSDHVVIGALVAPEWFLPLAGLIFLRTQEE